MTDTLTLPGLPGVIDLRSFPFPAGEIEHVETHVSHVVFAADRVYKLRKAVDLGFLDFTDPAVRRRCCEDEVRLNRALAPGVHLGVTPVTRREDGGLRFGGEGEAVEYATEMRRLPRHRMMDLLLEDGELDNEAIDRLAETLVRFHRDAPTGPGVDAWGSPAVIRENAMENFEALSPHVGTSGGLGILGPSTFGRLREWTGAELAARSALLAARVAEGRIRDGHGDLHAENVCYVDDRVLIYDRIEFSDRFRCGDVAADLAFLAMDLDLRAFRGASGYLVKRYAALADDPGLRELIPFYKTYRAMVRAKVSALLARELVARGSPEVAESPRGKAMRYVHLAASYVLPPALVLTSGLPGTGKSIFARALGRSFEALVLRSDRIRKTLYGFRATDRVPASRASEVYGEEANARTYRELAARARQGLRRGRTVIVDAAFPRVGNRAPFLELARQLGVPGVVAAVSCPSEVVRARLEARRGDVLEISDAGPEVHRAMAAHYEPPTAAEGPTVPIAGSTRAEDQVAALVEHLAGRTGGGVAGSPRPL